MAAGSPAAMKTRQILGIPPATAWDFLSIHLRRHFAAIGYNRADLSIRSIRRRSHG
jgi:hypothetical protein